LAEDVHLQIQVAVAQSDCWTNVEREPVYTKRRPADRSHCASFFLKAVPHEDPVLVIGQDSCQLGQVVLQAEESQVLKELGQVLFQSLDLFTVKFLAGVWLDPFHFNDEHGRKGTRCASSPLDEVVRAYPFLFRSARYFLEAHLIHRVLLLLIEASDNAAQDVTDELRHDLLQLVYFGLAAVVVFLLHQTLKQLASGLPIRVLMLQQARDVP